MTLCTSDVDARYTVHLVLSPIYRNSLIPKEKRIHHTFFEIPLYFAYPLRITDDSTQQPWTPSQSRT